MLISPAYQAIQRDMHARERYGHSGGKWAFTVAGIAALCRCKTLLDYGCGTGRMVANLRKPDWLEAHEYDPGLPGKSGKPAPADLVTCIDTLEHIEPDCLMEVLAELNWLTCSVLFTVVSTRLAGKILPDGRNAHLIVQPNSWWHDMIQNSGFRMQQNWTHTADEWCALWEVE